MKKRGALTAVIYETLDALDIRRLSYTDYAIRGAL
jgi:hypothetical protein